MGDAPHGPWRLLVKSAPMTQFERNQIRAKLHRLELDERFIERYLAPGSTGTQ